MTRMLSPLGPATVHGLTALFGHAHVELEQQAAAPFLFHEALGFLSIFLVHVEDHSHIGAFLGKGDGHGPPDAGVGPGDKRNFAP